MISEMGIEHSTDAANEHGHNVHAQGNPNSNPQRDDFSKQRQHEDEASNQGGRAGEDENNDDDRQDNSQDDDE